MWSKWGQHGSKGGQIVGKVHLKFLPMIPKVVRILLKVYLKLQSGQRGSPYSQIRFKFF